MRLNAKIGLSIYMGLVLSILVGYNVTGITREVRADTAKNHHHAHTNTVRAVGKPGHIVRVADKSHHVVDLAQVKKIPVATRVRYTWRYLRVLATAYLVRDVQDDLKRGGRCPVYNNLTASGTQVRRGSVAVDTGIFPFGTHMVIPGYGYGRARDTGGAINGHHIDLAMYSCKEARDWGKKHVVIAYRIPTRD
jgi:3D (Asp-Asp-Asp) domain-containing protein